MSQLIDFNPEAGLNGSTLGKGAFSNVKLVRNLKSGELFAMKEIELEGLRDNERRCMIQEAVQHSALSHPNIIKLYDYFIEEDKIYLILEYAQNGNLFKMMKKQRLNEQLIHKYFIQTVDALLYIHQQKLIHRDLKPENLLLDSNFNIKVCDFGWSGLQKADEKRNTFCGTLDYMSPEVLRGDNQSYEVDSWAMGILLYELFHDNTPFKGKTHHDLLSNILEKKPKISSMVPKDAKDLIYRLLNVDPSKRISLQDVKQHPFILRYPSYNTEAESEDKEKGISEKETEVSEKPATKDVKGSPEGKGTDGKKNEETAVHHKPESKAERSNPKFDSNNRRLDHVFSIEKQFAESQKKNFSAAKSEKTLNWNSSKFTADATRSTKFDKSHQKTGIKSTKKGFDSKALSQANNFSDFQKATASHGSGGLKKPILGSSGKAVGVTSSFAPGSKIGMVKGNKHSSSGGELPKADWKATVVTAKGAHNKDDSPNGATKDKYGHASRLTGGAKKPVSKVGTRKTTTRQQAEEKGGGDEEAGKEKTINVYSFMDAQKDNRLPSNLTSPHKK